MPALLQALYALYVLVSGVSAVLPISIPTSWSVRERAVAREISADGLRAHTRFLSDDLLEGRAPASRGGQLAIAYIHASLERLGLKPAAPDGTFLQTFAIVGLDSKVVAAPSLSGPKGALSPGLSPGDNFIITAGSQAPAASVKDAEVVFVGYGITAPEQSWDDYAGIDVRGKVVLVMNNDPERDPSLFGGKTRLYYGRWTTKRLRVTARPAPSSSTPPRRRVTRGRWCRPAGAAKTSSYRRRVSRGWRSRCG